jgi:O-antigen ligase
MIPKLQTSAPTIFIPVMLFVLLSGGVGFLASQGKELIGLVGILAVVGATIVIARPELGILLFLTSFFVTYGAFIPIEGRFTPNNLLGLLFSMLLVIKVYQERNLSFLKEKALQILLLIALVSHFSSRIVEGQLSNPFPELDLTEQSLHDLTTRVAFLIFFVNFIRTVRDVKLVVWTLLGIILVSAVSGMVNAFTGEGFGIGGYRASADWGISAAGNANRLAFYCVLGIAVSWYYKEVVRSKLCSGLFSAAIPVMAIAALLTASRSGLLNLFGLGMLFMTEGRLGLKRQFYLVVLAAVVIFLATDLLSDTHVERLLNLTPSSSTVAKGGSSTEKRLTTLMHGSKIIAENPLHGIGLGNFRWVRLQKFGTPGPPHNSYLAAAAEGGVPILALYLLLFWVTFKNFMQAERKSRSSEVRLIVRGLRTGLICFLFFTFFADFWLNIILYIFVGLGIVVARLQDTELPRNFTLRARYEATRA